MRGPSYLSPSNVGEYFALTPLGYGKCPLKYNIVLVEEGGVKRTVWNYILLWKGLMQNLISIGHLFVKKQESIAINSVNNCHPSTWSQIA